MSTKVNYAHNQQLSTTASDIIAAVPSGTISTPSVLSFYNTNASARRFVTVYIVEDGGDADTGTIKDSESIPAGGIWYPFAIINENFTAGMRLMADQDSGTDVNVNCSGLDDSV